MPTSFCFVPQGDDELSHVDWFKKYPTARFRLRDWRPGDEPDPVERRRLGTGYGWVSVFYPDGHTARIRGWQNRAGGFVKMDVVPVS